MVRGSQIVTYRLGAAGDGLALLSVHTRAIEMVGVKDYGPEVARSWAYGLTAEGYARSMANGERIEVAIIDGSIVGFCGIKLGVICGLFVDPDHMRRGVATQLLSHALAWMSAQGCERVDRGDLDRYPFLPEVWFSNCCNKNRRNAGWSRYATS